MKKTLVFSLIAASLSGLLLAGHYRYRGGYYYIPRRGFPAVYPYTFHYGYSPSFSLGVYRPSAYAPLNRCDVVRPYGSYYRGAPGTYPVVLSVPASGEVVRANFSDMIFNVTPSKAHVYVDGKLIGSARSFATDRDRYMITEGEHDLRIEFPGYQPFEATLDVMPNRTLRIDVELTR